MDAGDFGESFMNAFTALSRDLTVFLGIVNSVDEVNYVCEVTVGDSSSSTIYANVFLEVLTGVLGSFLCIPAVGSNVLMCFRNGNPDLRQILKSHQVAKFIANPTLWQFGDGSNGGLPMSVPVTTKLNNIENLLNDLVSKYNVHTHPVSGAATGEPVIPETGVLIPTQPTDIENPNVTQ